LQDKEDAREITQQVFYKLWTKKEKISIEYSPVAYLYKSVHNECMNYLKHNKIKAAHLKHVLADSEAVLPHDRPAEKELSRKINETIRNLPQQCGIIFSMSRFDDMKYKEIAGKLNISVKAVEKQITKALKILRTELQEFIPLLLLILLHK